MAELRADEAVGKLDVLLHPAAARPKVAVSARAAMALRWFMTFSNEVAIGPITVMKHVYHCLQYCSAEK
ncbi:hypothetical protein [Nocardia miyunensis]|uniref:hypothetical protein n=1 Tax=Nocardia miyunensis TaxID=282684 RepID=UPI0012F51554|nr:hypothetical protein [Nocardia miyunensis]